jgi:hypothetical protein
MAVNKNAYYKVFNGTDFDTINLRTLASLISLVDAGSKITATDVEGALQEIATNIATANTNIGTKLNSSAYTASDVLAKLLTVDGTGSLIDADKLDNKEGSAYWADTDIILSVGSNGGYIKFKNGLMIVFGSISAGVSGATSTFYTSFPAGCYTVLVSAHQSGATYATSARTTAWTNSGFTWDSWQGASAMSVGYINYIAIGH